MSKLIYTVSILIVFSSIGFAQNIEKATLLGSFDVNAEDLLNEIDKAGMKVEKTFNSQSDILAVRVCSNEPLPIALALSAGAAFVTTSRLQGFGIPKSNMYYLRYNNCRVRSHNYGATEYWFVPKNAEFPAFVEARRVSHISGYEMTHAGFVGTREPFDPRSAQSEKLNPELYEQTLQRISKLLKDNKGAVTIIILPQYKLAPTAELNKRVGYTLNYLTQRGVARHRILIKKIYPGYVIESGNEPRYPDISVVVEN